MKKVITVAFIAICLLTGLLYSCQKPSETIPTSKSGFGLSEIKLSKEIIDLDNKVSKNLQTRANWRKIAGYAEHDGGAAWAVFKSTSGIVGPGYGAAFGLLGGICGSLYYGWQQGDFGSISPYSPPSDFAIELDSDLGNPVAVGIAHNIFMSELIGNPEISFLDYESLMSTSYNYLVNRIADQFNLDASVIRENFSLAQYMSVGKELGFEVPYNIQQEIAKGANENILSYMSEYAVRFHDPNVTLEDLLLYSDLFIEDVKSQRDFNSIEIYNIIATISVFKYSLKFWSNV